MQPCLQSSTIIIYYISALELKFLDPTVTLALDIRTTKIAFDDQSKIKLNYTE